jgi:hypothetical protein
VNDLFLLDGKLLSFFIGCQKILGSEFYSTFFCSPLSSIKAAGPSQYTSQSTAQGLKIPKWSKKIYI